MRALPRGPALFLALLAGLAQAASLAAPWNGQAVWWLQLLSLGVLAWLTERAPTARSAALGGWLFGTAWLSGTFWWLFISMHVYGGLAAPLAALAVLALAGFLALYYAAACGLQRRLSSALPHAAQVLLFGALWMLAELARGNWFTGFPWGSGGYAHVDGPLAPLARHVGVYGLGMAAACLAYALAGALARPRERGRRDSLLILPLLAAWAWWAAPLTGQPAGRLDVALLQGNIPQDEKFQPGSGVPQALQWYGTQLGEAKASLVVAPETAIPLLPSQLSPDYWDALRARFADGRQAALVGMPLGNLREGYTNSVIGLKDNAKPYTYDKHHLVPFGEFIPPLFKWFTQMMNIPLGDFNRGAVGQASFDWQGQRLAPNICYEDLFGEELGARFTDAAQAPTVFVNLSNIGWFGNTVAIDQHLNISRLRAIEFERPMLRATNTGATVVIDHTGRVTHALARHTRGVLTGEVEGRTGVTLYAAWVARAGLWPLWVLGLAVLGLAWLAARRREA